MTPKSTTPKATTPRIGRYQIVRELGRGAMGVVYQATDPAIGRSVAIKTIRIREIHDAAQRQKLKDRLFREARSAGVLSHPNIVTIYDIDEMEGLAWIAMSHVKGPTLEQLLNAREPLPGARMVEILRQAAAGLDYAHSKGIVHRDIKPANIMTDEDGSVKITDFGIARINNANTTETSTVVGTPNYMSPEQIQGKPLDGRADQFSLAVIAYEMLAGRRPFEGEELHAVVYQIMHAAATPVQRVNRTLTGAVDQVLQRGFARPAGERFGSCTAFVDALEAALAAAPGWMPLAAGAAQTVEVAGAATAAVQSARKRVSLFWPVFVVVVVMLGIAGAVAWEGGLINPQEVGARVAGSGVLGALRDAVVDAFRNGDERRPAPVAPVEQAKPVETGTVEAKPSPLPAVLEDVAVKSVPAGARAVLDEQAEQACLTPCVLKAAQGAHKVQISAEGYEPETVDLTVGDAAVDVPLVTLKATPQ